MSVAGSPDCQLAAVLISCGWVPDKKKSPAAKAVNQLVANGFGSMVLPGTDSSKALPVTVAPLHMYSAVSVRATSSELRTVVFVPSAQNRATASPKPPTSVE